MVLAAARGGKGMARVDGRVRGDKEAVGTPLGLARRDGGCLVHGCWLRREAAWWDSDRGV